ncbi:MAG: hypothetical protein ACC612_12075 [Methanomethylovorans sp.]|uniref:hypothetical protein n=1 Tax=Methanomethylovorans sp. TaxID=2758717 RepID=UPI003530C005
MEKKSVSVVTNCHICNILNNEILDKSINEWLIDHYSGEHIEPLSIAALTNRFNEQLLQYYFLKQHPNIDPTFDFEVLREYLQEVYLDNDDHIDSKLFSIGNSIIKHFELDPIFLSTRLVAPHTMQHHLQNCLAIRPDKLSSEESLHVKFLQATEFAHKILQSPLDIAINNGLASADTQIDIYIKDITTGEMRPIKEWITKISKGRVI